MMRKSPSLLASLVLSLLPALAHAQGHIPDAQSNGVPRPLLDKLARGTNITRWFCYQGKTYPESHLKSYFTPADYQALADTHITYVRLCLSPDIVYLTPTGDLNPAAAPHLDAALESLSSKNLAILFDLHDNDQLQLPADTNDGSAFIHFWQTIATRYKGKYYDSVAFELLNEPVFKTNPEKWYALQSRAVAAIRAIDPSRTIVVTSTLWSGIDTLTQMTPLPDKNLLYTFHCYDPFFFTHQGASWVGDIPKNLKHIPFPATKESMQPARNAIAQQYPNAPEYTAALNDYESKAYDAAYIHARLSKAATWAEKHNLPLILGEFGAYPPVAPEDARLRWFAAVKQSLDTLHLSAALWGYDDALGLNRKLKDSTLTLDEKVKSTLYPK